MPSNIGEVDSGRLCSVLMLVPLTIADVGGQGDP